MLSTFVFAKDLTVDVCHGDNCYTYNISDVKNYTYIHDMTGRKYLRVFRYNRILDIISKNSKILRYNRILDIFVDGMTVKIGK
jgi:hypothetical protein